MKGCESREQAVTLAKSVVTSSLVKTAMYGHDANWGRILCAMGYSGADFDPMAVTIEFRSGKGTIRLMDKGTPVVFVEEKAADILSEHNIFIDMFLSEGKGAATAWGCDLTYDYVRINGDYRS